MGVDLNSLLSVTNKSVPLPIMVHKGHAAPTHTPTPSATGMGGGGMDMGGVGGVGVGGMGMFSFPEEEG
jgi:hypothetical protein